MPQLRLPADSHASNRDTAGRPVGFASHALLLGVALFGVALLGVALLGGSISAQEPPSAPKKSQPDTAQLEAWVRGAITDDAESIAKLVEAGPPVVPRVKPMFGSEVGKFEQLVRRLIEAELERIALAAPGLRFHGQYAHLAVTGDAGVDALMAIFLDDDVAVQRRRSAGYALGDIGNDRLVPQLGKVADDFLTEEWLEREAVYLLARFGDRTRVERWIAVHTEITEQELNSRTLTAMLGAHSELAEVFYRIRDYATAVRHHEKKLVLLRDLRERVVPELATALDEEIGLVRYNLACSLCLSGRIDDSFRRLEEGLEEGHVSLAMIDRDGDLARIRADERFKTWRKRWEARARAEKEKTR